MSNAVSVYDDITDAAVVALMDAGVHGALFETVVMIAKFSSKLSNGDWVFSLSGEQFGKRLGCNQQAASKRIRDAVDAGFIEKIANHCAGGTGATYRLRFNRKFETERYVMDRLLDDGFLGTLSPSAIKVLLFIGSKCNSEGVCYHSHETMMQLTGLSRNTIKNSIAELVKNKLIEVRAVEGKPNHYILL